MSPIGKFRRLLDRVLNETNKDDEDSTLIRDKSIIERFIADPDNTFLVSFPRTGSHWLRMMMELYFERPSLVRVFYFPDRQDYLTLHTHDLDLQIERTNVIYLYRNPINTIFSQMYYHKEDLNDRNRIIYWSKLYGQHLQKWLFEETVSNHKTILSYERMKSDLINEFKKVTQHFGQVLDQEKLMNVTVQVTKNEVKSKTQHDPQVVQLKSEYDDLRQKFTQSQKNLIWDIFLKYKELSQLRKEFV